MTDPFDDARSAFITLDDLLGRLVLVAPKELREEPSTLPGQVGQTYEKIIADTIVLDGKLTDAIEEIPFTLELMHWSGQAVVGQLKPKIRTKGMVLGRLGKQPSKKKGFSDAWILYAPHDEDKKLARPAASDYLEKYSDPFATA